MTAPRSPACNSPAGCAGEPLTVFGRATGVKARREGVLPAPGRSLRHPHRLGEEVPNRAALPGRTWDPDLRPSSESRRIQPYPPTVGSRMISSVTISRRSGLVSHDSFDIVRREPKRPVRAAPVAEENGSEDPGSPSRTEGAGSGAPHTKSRRAGSEIADDRSASESRISVDHRKCNAIPDLEQMRHGSLGDRALELVEGLQRVSARPFQQLHPAFPSADRNRDDPG